MEINSQNYESVLIDYFDGNLNALEVAEVLLFLEQHPEIKNEFEAFGTLPQSENLTVDHDFKLNLKKLNSNKSISDKSFNELIIAQMEGDCSETDSAIISQLIDSNPALHQLKKTFLRTKLVPDFSVIYPNKNQLKRKQALVFYLNKRYTAAAALILMVSMLFLIYRNTNNPIKDRSIAQTKIKSKEIESRKASIKTHETPVKTVEAVAKTMQSSSPALAPIAVVSNISNNKNNTVINEASSINNEPLHKLTIKSLANVEFGLAYHTNTPAGTQVPVSIISATEAVQKEDYLTISNFLKKKIIERGKNNLIDSEKPANSNELELDPMTVASAGAGIIEKATGKKVFLSRSYNRGGSLKSYTLAAGNFKFERIK
jgi:hypothetical protein